MATNRIAKGLKAILSLAPRVHLTRILHIPKVRIQSQRADLGVIRLGVSDRVEKNPNRSRRREYGRDETEVIGTGVRYKLVLCISDQPPNETVTQFELLKNKCAPIVPNKRFGRYFQISWFLEGQRILPDSRHLLEEHDTLAALRLRDISLGDLGNYSCLAENNQGRAKDNVELSGKNGITT